VNCRGLIQFSQSAKSYCFGAGEGLEVDLLLLRLCLWCLLLLLLTEADGFGIEDLRYPFGGLGADFLIDDGGVIDIGNTTLYFK
jgi:hypothetical protein